MSAAAGYVGMHVATRANTRTAHAAEESVAKALNISFKSGLTMGLCVASFALLGLSLWLIAAGVRRRPWRGHQRRVPLMHEHIGMVEGFATGASAVALFARVGGGIYTKAADVGADLVGKVEAGIPEDDPRNPATIADNVGDNVGDVAGMGADLFESYTGAILAPTILAVTFGSIGGYFATGDLVWAHRDAGHHRGLRHHHVHHRPVRRADQGRRRTAQGAQPRHLRGGRHRDRGHLLPVHDPGSPSRRMRSRIWLFGSVALRPGRRPRHRQDHRILLLRQVQAGPQDRRSRRHRSRHGHHRGPRHGHAVHHRSHRAGGAGHHRRLRVRQHGVPQRRR